VRAGRQEGGVAVGVKWREGGNEEGAGAGGCLRRLVTSPPWDGVLAWGCGLLLGERALCFGPFVLGGCPFVPSTFE